VCFYVCDYTFIDSARMERTMDAAANLALFLTDRTGSCCKAWKGKLTAAEQRALFGQYLGKGTIEIDGAAETLEHWRTVGFGGDWETTFSRKWGAL
jgi:hypothetical protein